jgi:iron-sulfur cluster assembly protein
MIKITQKALDKLMSLNTDKYKRTLRIAVIGGGCSGMSYKMEWIAESDTNHLDKLALTDPIDVVVDPKSSLFLEGLELDYSDDLNSQGFIFNNPNSKRSCGCGSSFST